MFSDLSRFRKPGSPRETDAAGRRRAPRGGGINSMFKKGDRNVLYRDAASASGEEDGQNIEILDRPLPFATGRTASAKPQATTARRVVVSRRVVVGGASTTVGSASSFSSGRTAETTGDGDGGGVLDGGVEDSTVVSQIDDGGASWLSASSSAARSWAGGGGKAAIRALTTRAVPQGDDYDRRYCIACEDTARAACPVCFRPKVRGTTCGNACRIYPGCLPEPRVASSAEVLRRHCLLLGVECGRLCRMRFASVWALLLDSARRNSRACAAHDVPHHGRRLPRR